MPDHWTLRIEPEGEAGRVDLPDELLSLLGLAIGDEVEVVVQDGGILIKPIQS